MAMGIGSLYRRIFLGVVMVGELSLKKVVECGVRWRASHLEWILVLDGKGVGCSDEGRLEFDGWD